MRHDAVERPYEHKLVHILAAEVCAHLWIAGSSQCGLRVAAGVNGHVLVVLHEGKQCIA